MPVRVLVIHPRDPAAPTVGGIQTFLHDFVKYAPADFEISIAGTTRDRRARPIGRMRTISVGGRTAKSMALAPSGGLPRTPLGLLAVLLAQVRLRAAMLRGSSILQVHRPYRRVYLAGQRGPRVQFVHVDIRDWPGPSAWTQMQRMYSQFSDVALHEMARTFVVNEPGAEILRSKHPDVAERIEFLPVWYDPATFSPADDARRTRLRAELVPDGERLILFAGRLDAIKDPMLALEAFAALVGHDAAPPARLVIAGSGELRDGIQRRAVALGLSDRVHLLGDVARERLAEVMRAADLLLLTSQAEGGGPRVVLEALACGVPVVAPPVGDVRRTVEHMVDGWLFEDRTPQAVCTGMAWVLSQPRDAIGAAAIRAAAPYTAEQVLSRVYDAYRQITPGGRR